MSELKKLTLTDLIKEKEKYKVKADVTEDLYLSRLDASITIRKPERSLCMESFEMVNDQNQAEKADAFMVYNIVVEPNLKDAKLQQEFGCVEPIDIVEKIFEIGEITQIAKAGLELAGYSAGVDKVKDLKN
ncbi:hypothetical protein NST17_06900 [Caldifermentibacillus hisashii]|uniref:Phage XkdN-like protein n=1 Tax=Caldifermentibacillus hisashii TaxID=996558 RepID=A0ABU9JVP5_9BACI